MHFRGRLIDEALTVQRVPAWPGVRPRPRRAARARGTAAAATTAWAAAADRTRRARGRRCDTAPPSSPGVVTAAMARISRSRRCRGASGGSSGSRQLFFWSVMIVSARCSFRCSRRFSASSCFTRGSTGRGVGPRRRPRIACRAPASRCRRQFVKSDEYNPSRRSRAPTSPGRLHASTSLRMRSRYAGGKRRRSTFAGTSGSGSLARDPVTGPGPPVALRPRPRDRVDLHDFWHARHLSNLPRPYTNLIREVVSQIIGTGGCSNPTSAEYLMK